MSPSVMLAHYWAAQVWPLSVQIGVLVAIVYVLGLLLRGAPARYRYLLWLIVLVRLCAPISIISPLGLGQYPERLFRAGARQMAPPPDTRSANRVSIETRLSPTSAADPSIVGLPASSLPTAAAGERPLPACIVWLSGVFILGLTVIVRTIHGRRSAQRYRRVERPDLIALVQRLSQGVGLRGTIKVFEVDEPRMPIPAVQGVRRSAMILPGPMVRTWTLEALEPVLLHELVHIKRRDSLVNWAQIILQILYFFHPMVWLANWSIRRERELACDDEVVRRSRGCSTAYVRSMLMVAETLVRPPRQQILGIAMAENSSNLGRRIRRMMQVNYRGSENHGFTYAFAILMVGLFCIALSAQGMDSNVARPGTTFSPPIVAQGQLNPSIQIHQTETQESKAQQPEVQQTKSQEVSVSPVAAPRPVRGPQSTEPFRMGNNVQESKLIQRVDPIMPKEALDNGIAGMVTLEVLANETGYVESVRVLLSAPLFDSAAMNAVRQWRYSPTLLNGQPIRVIANVVLGFGIPNKISIDKEGYVKDPDGGLISFTGIRQFQGTFVAIPDREITYETLDSTVKGLQANGIQKIQLISSDFVSSAGRLYYAPFAETGLVAGGVRGGIVGGVSGGVVGGVPAGPPPPPRPVSGVVGGIRGVPASGAVQPAQLDIDIAALSAKAKAAVAALPPGTPAGDLTYRVFVSETGEIISVERLGGADLPEIQAALAQARVLSPGRRDGKPVPVAIRISIPVR